jgi:hypothetical protein
VEEDDDRKGLARRRRAPQLGDLVPSASVVQPDRSVPQGRVVMVVQRGS